MNPVYNELGTLLRFGWPGWPLSRYRHLLPDLGVRWAAALQDVGILLRITAWIFFFLNKYFVLRTSLMQKSVGRITANR